MYDIFYVSKGEGNTKDWTEIKSKYPLAQRLTNIRSYEDIRSKSFTKMFWVIWDDIKLTSFNLSEYKATKWDDMYVHVFKNGEHYDGVCLFPKHKLVSKKEFEHRFFTEKKEIDIQASVPKAYDKFYIDTYEEYLQAAEKSTTDMFWCVWNDIIIADNFEFNYYIPYYDLFHKNINHVFKNGEHYDGVCLFPKHKLVSKKEFEHRFFTEKKEIDIVASHPLEYNIYNLKSYDDYLTAVGNSKTNMFWAVWDNIEVKKDFKFDYQVPTYNQHLVHVFKNKNYYDGICLLPKSKIYSRKEIEFRFFIDKIEVDKNLSDPKTFDIFYINDYEEYLKAENECRSDMFWAVWNDLEILSTFKFDYQVPTYNQHLVHVFKNKNYYDGICLMPKKTVYSRKEIEFRFFTDKVEVDIDSSIPKKFDIVFISYQEPNADENFVALKSKYPDVKRVHGITGIHNAHIKAAALSNTKMFWVVDGDAQIVDGFKFEHQVAIWDQNTVHVWRSRNPINDLEYGYGGVKLLPTKLTMNMDMTKPDMTTSISSSFKPMPTTSNITGFNTDGFTTWRSAFRECVKLASRSIQGQIDKESEERLDIWCTAGSDKLFGEYAIDGALTGKEYGLFNRGNIDELRKINDFKWLEEQFCERYRKN